MADAADRIDAGLSAGGVGSSGKTSYLYPRSASDSPKHLRLPLIGTFSLVNQRSADDGPLMAFLYCTGPQSVTRHSPPGYVGP